jgi:hypothetical protein
MEENKQFIMTRSGCDTNDIENTIQSIIDMGKNPENKTILEYLGCESKFRNISDLTDFSALCYEKVKMLENGKSGDDLKEINEQIHVKFKDLFDKE